MRTLAGILICAVIGATAQAGEAQHGTAPASFRLASPAFAAGAAIPSKFTCQGANVSPPLAWHGVPAGTKTLALVIYDPDAPDPAAPTRTWVHWVIYDIPVTAHALDEAARTLPEGTRDGLNDWHRTGYGGPCPPIGRHRYVHVLYALDRALPDLGQATRAELGRAMAGHVLGKAELIGTYQKH